MYVSYYVVSLPKTKYRTVKRYVPADGSLMETYPRCSYLANASEVAPTTFSLPFRPLSVAARPRAHDDSRFDFQRGVSY